MNLKKIAKEFNKRHDFNSDDLKVLQNNFPNIKFKNIPEAWIVLIDSMLLELKKYNYIVNNVSQYFGHLIIKSSNTDIKFKKIVAKYEKNLYSIDIDLHDTLRKS